MKARFTTDDLRALMANADGWNTPDAGAIVDFLGWVDNVVPPPTIARLADDYNAAMKGVIPFTHWSKDPLVPYTGCECSSCAGVRPAHS